MLFYEGTNLILGNEFSVTDIITMLEF